MKDIKEVVNTVICGDSSIILKSIPDECINIIITSPPYNVGKPYGTNDRKNYQEYLKQMEDIFTESYRVLISGGRIAVNCPSAILQSTYSRMAYLSLDFCLLLRKIGFLDREWITWIKMKEGGIPGKSTSWGSWRSPSCPYLRDASEFIIIMDKGQHKRTDKKGKNDIIAIEFLKYTSNVWYFPPETSRKHPAPFPLELPFRLIRLYTWEGDIVLDPFVGSGTTAVVAKKLGRNYIGIDIKPEYVEMSQQRLNQIPESLF